MNAEQLAQIIEERAQECLTSAQMNGTPVSLAAQIRKAE